MESPAHCSRRRFFWRLMGGLSLLVCGGFWPAAARSPFGRPIDRYTPARLPGALQTGDNPHLKPPHRQVQVFGLDVGQRKVPGSVFTTGDYPVRAVAPGIVHFIGQRSRTDSEFCGYYLRIAHDLYDGLKRPFYPRVTLYRRQAYRSTYYGLQTVSVEHWQSARRGQIIGKALPTVAIGQPAIKMVLEERGNPVNPDDFGSGHRPMRYLEDQRVPERRLAEMHRCIERQEQVIEQLNTFYVDRSTDDLRRKIHGVIDTEKFADVPVFWSTVEKFRYLQHRFHQSPHRFPGLPSTALDNLVRTFTENQPIVLTLPFSQPT